MRSGVSQKPARLAKWNWLAVGAVALLVLAGTVYSFYLGNDLRIWDEQQYVALARNVASGNGYTLDGKSPTALWPPGYPLALAPLVAAGASNIHLRLFNVALLAAAAGVLYGWIKRQMDAPAGVIGLGMVVLYPVLLYAAGNLYPQMLGALLLLAALFVLTGKNVTAWGAVVAGGLLSYAVLTIPTFVFALLVILGWLVVSRRMVRIAAGAGVVSLLLIGLWTARNYAAFHSFVFVSTNSGFNLLVGNSEETNPGSGLNINFEKFFAEAGDRDELESDAYFRARALDYIRADVPRAVQLYLSKVLNYFNFRNELVQAQTPVNPDLVMLVGYGCLLGLLVVRLVLFRRLEFTNLELLLVTLYIGNAFVQAIFFTRIRFRLPFDFLLIALDAMFLRRLTVHLPVSAHA